jgi:hypothetical protein
MKTYISYSILITLFFLFGCNKVNRPIPQVPDYSDNYRYYPTADSATWIYNVTTIDHLGDTIDEFEETRIYTDSLRRVDTYVYNQFKGYRTWANIGNKLRCCVDRVLLDYYKLNCDEDSVVIDSLTHGLTHIISHQFCKQITLDNLEFYKDLNSVKTRTKVVYDDESYLIQITYFALDIGLLYSESYDFTSDGRLDRLVVSKLTSHKIE